MRILTLLLVAGIALSGCASDDPGEPVDPLADSDGDGFPDSLELEYESDPHNTTSVPAVIVHEPISFTDTGMILFGTEVVETGCGVHGDIDTAVLTWSIQGPANATDVHVVDLSFTATLPPTMIELDIFVFGPDGTQLTEATTASIPPIKTDTVVVDGKQPVGDYRIEIRGCEGSGEVKLDATGTLGYMPSVEELLHMKGVEHQH